ncbi:MAG: DUF1775 domain-containing protein [Acidobacteria bacterium]|nr:DUF1775 domain-containing protein [Acidobacteriota bacterium]
MKLGQIACFVMIGSLFALDAFAHVGVFPRQATAGALHQFLRVRAPVEKEIPTVELKIEIPPEWKAAGGAVNRVELDPLWKVALERDEDDWIRSITWSGAEAPDYAYIDFGIIVTMPKLTGMQQIKAYQKYSDDSVVAWVEDRNKKGTEKPAAGLTLVEAEEGEEGARAAAAAGGSMLYYGLSGLIGGIIGAGLAMVVRKK